MTWHVDRCGFSSNLTGDTGAAEVVCRLEPLLLPPTVIPSIVYGHGESDV